MMDAKYEIVYNEIWANMPLSGKIDKNYIDYAIKTAYEAGKKSSHSSGEEKTDVYSKERDE